MKNGKLFKQVFAAFLCVAMLLCSLPGSALNVYAAEAKTSDLLWKQYGEIDTTTGGAWRTVGGYGTEQAIFISATADQNNKTHGNQRSDGGGRLSTYSQGGSPNFFYAVDPYNADGIELVYPGLSEEYWTYIGTQPGTPAEVNFKPAYETPTDVFKDYIPQFNTYTAYHNDALQSTIPFSDVFNTRNIAAFNVPESKDGKVYRFSVYLNTANFVENPNMDFELFLVDMNNQEIEGSRKRYNTSDFDAEGGYITFLVKGDFKIALDRYWNIFGFTAFFFDEYVEIEEIPENVLEGTDAKLWNTYGEIDTTTGGAWRTVGGYGTEQAIFISGLGDQNNVEHKDIMTDPTGRRSTYYVADQWPPNYVFAETPISEGGSGIELVFSTELCEYDAYWTYIGTQQGTPAGVNHKPAYETPADVFTSYVPQYNTYTAYSNSAKQDTIPYSSDTDFNTRNIATFDVPTEKEGNLYCFRVYLNTANFEVQPEMDFELYLLDMNYEEISQRYRFNTRDFDAEGGYITFLVQGDFKIALDRYWNIFGFTAFFFDEYKPLELVTPEAGATYENWTQVGEIDQTTGGYWHTKGYGDEQATFISAFAAPNNSHHGNRTTDGVGRTSTYWNSVWPPNFVNAVAPISEGGSGIELVFTQELNDYGAYWTYIGTEEGTPANVGYKAAYETPAEVFKDYVPLYNTYTAYGSGNLLTDTIPFSTDTDFNTRNIATFDVPTEKEGNTYYFSVYLNTANFTAEPNMDFELFFLDMNNQEIEGSRKRYNTSDFGAEGGYVTFQVQGDFKIALDRYWNIFGFTAFFFNKKPVRPAPQSAEVAEVGTLLKQDFTTGGAWHTVGGYGDEQAVFISAIADQNNKAHNGQRTDGSGRLSTYSEAGFPNFIYAVDPYNAGGIELVYDTDLCADTGTYWTYIGTQSGTPAGVNHKPAYETPAEIFKDYIPQFNTYTAYGTFDTNTIPFSADTDFNTRNVATFNIPTEKEGNLYCFSVYLNTANFVEEPNMDFELFLLDMNNQEIEGSRKRYNTSDFGAEGGYVTFLVKGDFKIVLDRYWNIFGFTAFFFDKYIPQKDEATSLSVTLGDPIGVNYGMNFSVQALLDSGAKMVFTQAGKPNVEISMANASRNDLVWFTKGVSAKEMADTITGQMVYSDGSTGKEYQQSVQGYARKLLGYTTTYENVALKDLVVRMLNYGAACQTYWNYNTGNMANKDLATAVKTNGLSSVGTANLAKYARTVQAGNDVISLSYASLLLKSETILRLGFTNAQAAGKTFKLNGVTLTPTVRGTNTYVDITNIAAAELDNTYTVEIYEGETLVSTVKYSPLAYVHAVLTSKSDDANLINVVKSLYLYNVAANEYFK